MKNYDVIVVGSGGMGSAVAYHLAKRGARALVLERFSLNHSTGSSHGRTRIIRSAYFEHEIYVPLVQRALRLWTELQREAGTELFTQTGGVMIGRPEGPLFSGSRRSALIHSIPHQVLTASELSERFPVFRPGDYHVALFEPGAGILFPEKCIEAHKTLAEHCGVEFRFNESVQRWYEKGQKVNVVTSHGEYECGKLVLAAGAWTSELLNSVSLPLKIERQVPFWFKPRENTEAFTAERMPVFVWEDGAEYHYGIPDLGEGVKVAKHHGGQTALSPNLLGRQVTSDDEITIRHFLEKCLPWANGIAQSSSTCLYTNTPDNHFVLDFHPKNRNVLIVSCCSGHGFKFASVIGEIAATLTLEGKTEFDTQLFNIGRFV